ncbi:conserved hypothetical protein [Helicobacter cinaedi CCUG 18818 = ATCC BAA-847]|uniref:Methyltransferase domain-containing protein n=1 Tax=Helicobacter cinaedi CCUG 18818 = ATCC BAA-847 TaxID=537971 RepID=A0AAI8QH80_9HELI|nr:methyltransferase domain-containing protein [Helicobacter cinaedi]BAM32458.1 conserved hypothetical protein [Helicobacter cinaedi CCUG 18818 = ATCC BAA-847]
MNEFLKFYGEHHISPVSQDISDFERHLARRKRLYELVNIHPFAFRGARMLEVGAGSGYNTLLFLKLGAIVDIVEPNAAGREQMIKLFTEYKIPQEQYKIHPCTIESYDSAERYDFIIAEGFLPWVDKKQRKGIITQLWRYAKKDAGIVVTTQCEFSFFLEDLRRILGLVLVRRVSEFKQKVEMLSKAFVSHLQTLGFASRPIADWVIDNILNPAADVKPLSIQGCVEEFASVAGGGYSPSVQKKISINPATLEVLGSSPNMIGNLSWYKDMSYSYGEVILESFERFRHILLCTEFGFFWREDRKNTLLLERLSALRELIKAYRESESVESVKKICDILDSIIAENEDLGEFFTQSVNECVGLLRDYADGVAELNAESIASMPTFKNAWGRGQQYVSFVKRIEENRI